jgi:hypothetical protein
LSRSAMKDRLKPKQKARILSVPMWLQLAPSAVEGGEPYYDLVFCTFSTSIALFS